MSFPSTPVSVGLYNRLMMEMFDEKDYVGLPTGFLSFFGRPGIGRTTFSPDSLELDIDIIRANEKIAKLIPRGTQSKPVGSFDAATKTRFTERNMIFPLGEELSSIDANQLMYRMAGENPFSANSKLDKLRAYAAEHHKEHIRRFVRTWELQAATALITGKQPGIIGTTDTGMIIDFKRKSTHTVTVSTSWATVTTDILGDVDTACELVRQDAHVTPDIALVSQTAMAYILKNTAILAQLDNRNVDAGLLTVGYTLPPRLQFMVDNGFTPRGKLNTPKGHSLYLFTYLDGYDNDAGTYTNYLADDKFVVLSSQARMDRAFGPGERLPMVGPDEDFFASLFGFSTSGGPLPMMDAPATMVPRQAFFHDAIIPSDRKSVVLRTQCAPLFIPTMVDAVVTLDVTP